MGYIKQFYDKPSHLTWEVFYNQVNSEFKRKQDKSIAQIAEKRKIREENERKKQLQIDKEKQDKEEKDRLTLQQKLQVQQQLKKEQDEREERERKRVEEAQRMAAIEEERKHNETKKAVEQIAENALVDLLGLEDDNEEEEQEQGSNVKPVGVDLSNVKKEKDEETDPKAEAKSKEELFEKIFDLNQADYRIALKNYDLNKSLEAYLQQVGGLVMDPDVLHALRNLKELGRSMRCAKGGDETVSQANNSGILSVGVGVSVNPNGQCPRELFPEKSPSLNNSQLATEIKQENTSDQNSLRSNSALVSPPPPGRMFPGLKRQTSETFNESISAKKKRGTPARKNIISPVTSPLRSPSSVDECISKADTVCKLADLGNVFLKKKKITATNSQAIVDAVNQYSRTIVEFNVQDQSFMKIMTYYFPSLSHLPEDVRHMELKKQLFEFTMKNIEYTKVCIIF